MMMSYEMFCEVVKEKFTDYLPEEYKNGVPEIRSVNKVNQLLDGITVRLEGVSDITPNMYINDMYESYQHSGNLDDVLSYAAEQYMEAVRDINKNKPVLDTADLKDNVVMCLINSEQNKEMLQNIPSKEFQDLSVIYRWVLSQDAIGMRSIIVTNNIMCDAGLTEEELFQYASENTKRIFPVKIAAMQEIIMETAMMEGMPPEIAEELQTVTEPKESMWVITNETGINGAASMLYEKELHKLAEKIGTDLYILPSSLHEVIATSVEMAPLEFMSDLVQEANRDACQLANRLSNNVYHYDKDLRKLTMATDVPNKRLDGIVDEPPLVYETEKKR